jgi:hypothetical protein
LFRFGPVRSSFELTVPQDEVAEEKAEKDAKMRPVFKDSNHTYYTILKV